MNFCSNELQGSKQNVFAISNTILTELLKRLKIKHIRLLHKNVGPEVIFHKRKLNHEIRQIR